MKEITQEYLKECFNYNPETGDLIWKERPEHHFKNGNGKNRFNGRNAGKIAGTQITIRNLSYVKIGLRQITKTPFCAHRLIWMLIYGEWPNTIDHINGNGADNRLINLRNVTRHENLKNLRTRNSNTSGCTGVYWSKYEKKWQSYIRCGGKNKHLGFYEDWFEAVCARKSAEHKHGYHENHGRR